MLKGCCKHTDFVYMCFIENGQTAHLCLEWFTLRWTTSSGLACCKVLSRNDNRTEYCVLNHKTSIPYQRMHGCLWCVRKIPTAVSCYYKLYDRARFNPEMQTIYPELWANFNPQRLRPKWPRSMKTTSITNHNFGSGWQDRRLKFCVHWGMIVIWDLLIRWLQTVRNGTWRKEVGKTIITH